MLASFFLAHGTFHFMSQSFAVMLPEVKVTLGISPVQIGVIMGVRELSAGLASLPGGVISDYLRRHRTYLMAICMVVFSLGWLIIAVAAYYPLLILGMAVLAAAGSIWHLPSLAELGSRFARNRGSALAVHGAGGSLGDITGPVLTGILLGMLPWQRILPIYTLVPILLAVWMVWAFGRKRQNQSQEVADAPQVKEKLRTQLKTTRDVLKHTHIWRVNMVAGLRGMCFVTLVTFLPLFMKEELGFSTRSVGIHIGLLWAIGIVASPILGHLSDRWGRKIVLVPALLYSCTFISLLALVGHGMGFTLLIIMLGVSLRSDYSLVSATVLDITGTQVATTMLGMLSFTRFLMAAAGPLIAGILYQYMGMQVTLFFVAGLFAAAAIIFASVDLTLTAASLQKEENLSAPSKM